MEKKPFQEMMLKQLGIHSHTQNESRQRLYILHKIKSKLTKELNAKHKTIKFLEG